MPEQTEFVKDICHICDAETEYLQCHTCEKKMCMLHHEKCDSCWERFCSNCGRRCNNDFEWRCTPDADKFDADK